MYMEDNKHIDSLQGNKIPKNKDVEKDFSHKGESAVSILMGEKMKCVEKYRTKNYVCYQTTPL